MIALKELLENQLALSLILLIVGGVITFVFTKIANKTGVFRYYTTSTKIGISADDNIFGSVRSTWQGHEMRNLYLCAVEVENTTSKDYENIEFKVYTGNETLLLNQRTEIIDSPNIVPLSTSYSDRLAIPDGEEATDAQVNEYRHSREYELPVFNRGQVIRFSYLCTNPNDNNESNVYINTPSKGVKLKRRNTPYLIINPIFGVPVSVAIIRALIVSVFVVVATSLWINNIWLASSICMLVGLTGQIFGAMVYRVEKFVINTFSG